MYAASATGGNDFARDFLAGIASIYSAPLYQNIGNELHLEYATTILACIAVLVTVPIYFFYRMGPAIRDRSPFAKQVSEELKQRTSARSAASRDGNAGGGDAVQSQRVDAEAAYL